MNWAGRQHPIETLVEWLAPVSLAAAFGWSALGMGFARPVAALIAAAVLVAALFAIRTIGRPAGIASPTFEPVPFDSIEAELGELLLDNPILDHASAGELLLDDALTDIGDDARVVRLFARQEPTPGELAARIDSFLGDGARPAGSPDTARAIPDAGAALKAALANVRASLR